MDSRRIQSVIERSEIIDTLTTFTRAADMRDWDTCRTILGETVINDHGTPETLSRDALIERWRVQSPTLDLIHHVTTDHLVAIDGDLAKVNTQFIITVRATGAPSGDLCTRGGSCDYDLKRTDEGWKLTGFKSVIQWSMGNVNI